MVDELKDGPARKNCLKCGGPLGPDSRQGFCPRCIFADVAAMISAPGTLEDSDGTDLPPHSAASALGPITAAPRRFGDYELFEEIGRGGMAIVFRARQLSVGRDVALKLLHFGPMASEETIKRLRMEATAAGSLRHPNIVAIHEVGIHNDQHYLVMDYVAGPNLAEVVANQPWPAARAATLARLVAETVQYAHDRGVLHRDLKPSNILLDTGDQPRLTDFGLAKRITTTSPPALDPTQPLHETQRLGEWIPGGGSLTLTGQVIGSPNYMPPEQACGDRGKVGRYSDVYSLGAILYHLLCGRPPFLGETITATLHQVLETEATSPRLLNPRVPIDLETICLKCLEKDPPRRYASAGELAEELDRFLKNEPIRARPVGPLQRVLRWCRRNRLVTSLALVTLMLLLTVAIGSPIAVYRIDRERQKAVRSASNAQVQLYTMQLRSVEQAWNDGHLFHFDQLLRETRASPERNFEWNYWRKQVQLVFPALRGHLGRVNTVAFSPDNQRVVTGSEDNSLVVWDAGTLREIVRFEAHQAPVSCATWFPDGRYLVSGSHDHSIRIWDAVNAQELFSIRSRRGRIAAMTISADGRTIVSGNQDGTATIWDVQGTVGMGSVALRERRVLQGHRREVTAVSLSADGQWLATGSDDATARIWKLATGRLVHVLEGHADYVRSVAFSRDGTRIVTGSWDGTAAIWDARAGKRLFTLKGHTDWVSAALISPDGTTIVTLCLDGSARLWRIQDGQLISTVRLHEASIQSGALSSDGLRLLTGGRDNIARIWTMSGKVAPLEFRGHKGIVRSVAFSHNGEKLLSGGDDGTARIWDIATRRQLRIFDLRDGFVSTAFSPDSRRIVLGTIGGAPTRVWDVTTGDELIRLPIHDCAVWAATYSPDGRRIVTADYFGTIKVADAASGRELHSLRGHSASITSLSYSSDGQLFASTSMDGTSSVWDSTTGKQRQVLRGDAGAIYSAVFSPDRRKIVTGGIGRLAKVWDTATGEELFTLRGHAGVVQSVAFSPDGTRIVTASHDGTVRVWHAGHGGLLLTLASTQGPWYGAVMSPDGTQIAASTGSSVVSIWTAASAQDLEHWDEEERAAQQRLEQRQKVRDAALEARRAEQARDPGAIREWLLLLPIPIQEHEGARALDVELYPGERQLRPEAGDLLRFGQTELSWRAVQQQNHVIDFAAILGYTAEGFAAYAVCYIESEQRQAGLRLLVGSDDQSEIHLNGNQVFESRYKRGFVEDENVVEGIQLNAGKNVLLLKVINVTSEWKASVRLTDARGEPVQGLRINLEH